MFTPGLARMIRRHSKPYTVTRTPERAHGAGGFLPDATPTVLQIMAHWQPAEGGRTGELLSGGTRVNEGIMLWTETELKAGPPGKEADVINIDGKQFEVSSVEAFGHLGAMFYHVNASQI